MMDKNKYDLQRQYLENLSHELLTPLSIIRGETELLLQSENLKKEDVERLDRIVSTVNRLSRINKGLILLSKLSEGVYIDRESIDVSIMLENILLQYENQITIRKLKVHQQIQKDCIIETSPILVEILLTNAIKNAITHNHLMGELKIVLKRNELLMENTGRVETEDVSRYFSRFVSGEKSISKIGLGLSIMKQICDELNYEIQYDSVNGLHAILIRF